MQRHPLKNLRYQHAHERVFEMTLQVDASHYYHQSYDTKERWISYWYQLHEVLKANPANCLEVGCGNGTVRTYLRSRGLEVTVVDIDATLEPDRVGDIRSLPCADNEFDVVLCAEVLEHLPFGDVPKALKELQRVSRRLVILSIPHTGRLMEFVIRAPWLPRLAFRAKLPGRRTFTFDGQHYWEANARNFPIAKVLKVISASFTVQRDYLVPEYPYHHFFILENSAK